MTNIDDILKEYNIFGKKIITDEDDVFISKKFEKKDKSFKDPNITSKILIEVKYDDEYFGYYIETTKDSKLDGETSKEMVYRYYENILPLETLKRKLDKINDKY